MAGLTSPPGFGTNSWNEEKWSRAGFVAGERFLVGGPTHWRPTISTTADRTINISSGWGYCCGVYDEITTESIQFAANTGGSVRNDLLVARFDWNTNTRVFAIIQGGLNPPPVNQTQSVDAASINRIPGLRFDAVIAVVTVRPNVGTFAAADLADIRLWMSGGQITAPYDHGLGRNVIYSTSTVDPGGTIMALDTGRMWRNIGGGDWVFAGGTPPRAAFRTVGQEYGNGTSKILGWGPQVLGDTDFIRYTGNGDFQFTRPGTYMISALVDSDGAIVGRSRVALNLAGVDGGFSSIVDDRTRPTTSPFPGSQALTQSLTSLPVSMIAGSTCNIEIFQNNTTGANVVYNAWLNVVQTSG